MALRRPVLSFLPCERESLSTRSPKSRGALPQVPNQLGICLSSAETSDCRSASDCPASPLLRSDATFNIILFRRFARKESTAARETPNTAYLATPRGIHSRGSTRTLLVREHYILFFFCEKNFCDFRVRKPPKTALPRCCILLCVRGPRLPFPFIFSLPSPLPRRSPASVAVFVCSLFPTLSCSLLQLFLWDFLLRQRPGETPLYGR